MLTSIHNRRTLQRQANNESSLVFQEMAKSWSIETRQAIQHLMHHKNHFNIKPDMFCLMLSSAINDSAAEFKEEEPSPYEKNNKQTVKNEHNVTLVTQDPIDEDCKSEDSEPDFEPSAAFLGSLLQDVDHGENAKQISNQYRDVIITSPESPTRSTLNRNAPKFVPNHSPKSARDRWMNKLGSICETEELPATPATPSSAMEDMDITPLPTSDSSVTPTDITESTDINVEPANMAPTNDLGTAINNIIHHHVVYLQNLPITPGLVMSVPNQASVQAIPAAVQPVIFASVPNQMQQLQSLQAAVASTEICQPPTMLHPTSAPNYVQTQTQSDEVRNEDNTADDEINEDQKMDENNNESVDKPIIPAKILKKFHPKFTNHAKGNFYISKEMVSEMTEEAMEDFVTNDSYETDEKLAFGYYKESVAMQINDEQLSIIQCNDGKLRIIINIDLHSKRNGLSMYLVAEENEEQFRNKVRWCIVAFMTEKEIYHQFGVLPNQLPASSRNMDEIQEALNNPPVLRRDEVQRLLKRTKFRGLPKKTSKRKDNRHKALKRTQIGEYWLKKYCQDSWNDHDAVPVVVIKGNGQWIEWKKFIRIEDRFGNPEWVGMSLRYYPANRRWKIECMDYDAGRIYYQHRLVGLSDGDDYSFSHDELQQYVTTSLEIQ